MRISNQPLTLSVCFLSSCSLPSDRLISWICEIVNSTPTISSSSSPPPLISSSSSSSSSSSHNTPCQWDQHITTTTIVEALHFIFEYHAHCISVNSPVKISDTSVKFDWGDSAHKDSELRLIRHDLIQLMKIGISIASQHLISQHIILQHLISHHITPPLFTPHPLPPYLLTQQPDPNPDLCFTSVNSHRTSTPRAPTQPPFQHTVHGTTTTIPLDEYDLDRFTPSMQSTNTNTSILLGPPPSSSRQGGCMPQ